MQCQDRTNKNHSQRQKPQIFFIEIYFEQTRGLYTYLISFKTHCTTEVLERKMHKFYQIKTWKVGVSYSADAHLAAIKDGNPLFKRSRYFCYSSLPFISGSSRLDAVSDHQLLGGFSSRLGQPNTNIFFDLDPFPPPKSAPSGSLPWMF